VRGRVQGGVEVGIAFGGRHGSVHQAEDHRHDGGGADGGGLELAGPRLRLLIVNFRRPFGRRNPETLKHGVALSPRPRRVLGRKPSLTSYQAKGGPVAVLAAQRISGLHESRLKKPSPPARVTTISLPRRLVDRIDDFRFERRLSSRAEAIRQLIEVGLWRANETDRGSSS
jgi:hypothetical protein